MGTEKVNSRSSHRAYLVDNYLLGGKAKPLKAPKKDKKELDDDDLAFREKQKAGRFPSFPYRPSQAKVILQRRRPTRKWPRKPRARDQ